MMAGAEERLEAIGAGQRQAQQKPLDDIVAQDHIAPLIEEEKVQ